MLRLYDSATTTGEPKYKPKPGNCAQLLFFSYRHHPHSGPMYAVVVQYGA